MIGRAGIGAQGVATGEDHVQGDVVTLVVEAAIDPLVACSEREENNARMLRKPRFAGLD